MIHSVVKIDGLVVEGCEPLTNRFQMTATEIACAFDGWLIKLNFWITGFVFKIVPCILLTIFMGLLLKILLDTSRRRKRLLREDRRYQQSQGERTTCMLILIVAIFLLTELPQGIFGMLSEMIGFYFHMVIYNNLGDVLDLLSLINSSVNFILYCSMSRKYQEVFYDVFIQPFRSKLAKKPDGTSTKKTIVANTNGTTFNPVNHPETKDPAAAENAFELRNVAASQPLLPVDS